MCSKTRLNFNQNPANPFFQGENHFNCKIYTSIKNIQQQQLDLQAQEKKQLKKNEKVEKNENFEELEKIKKSLCK